MFGFSFCDRFAHSVVIIVRVINENKARLVYCDNYTKNASLTWVNWIWVIEVVDNIIIEVFKKHLPYCDVITKQMYVIVQASHALC